MLDLLPLPTKAPSAHDRLLRAALIIFSREGLHGATTRGIAKEAEVNEVTLFRLFGSKEGLLGALLSTLVATAVSENYPQADDAKWSGTASLRDNLHRFAERYYALLAGSETFIRVMIAEARRHPEHARKIIHDAARPLHMKFVAHLESARSAGKVREDLDLTTAAQAFMDTLFSGMLRHTAGFCVESSTPEDFISTCSEIYAAGLEPRQSVSHP